MIKTPVRRYLRGGGSESGSAPGALAAGFSGFAEGSMLVSLIRTMGAIKLRNIASESTQNMLGCGGRGWVMSYRFPNVKLIEHMKTLVKKSITKLSLVILTAAAFAAFPVSAQTDSTSTNAAPAAPRKTPGFVGTISAVDATAMTLTLKARTGDVTVKVTSDTKITKDREPAVFADAKEGLRVSGAGKKQDDGSWVATTLRISTKVRRPAGTPPATPPPSTSEQK